MPVLMPVGWGVGVGVGFDVDEGDRAPPRASLCREYDRKEKESAYM